MAAPASSMRMQNLGVEKEHNFENVYESFLGNKEINEKAYRVANFIELFMRKHQTKEGETFDSNAVNIKIGIGDQHTNRITEIIEYNITEESLDELIIEDIDYKMESLPKHQLVEMRLVKIAAEITLYKTDSLAPCFLAQLDDLPQSLWFESKLFKSIIYKIP